jgi:hypothetical protein
MRAACAGGHLAVVEFLVGRFALTKNDVAECGKPASTDPWGVSDICEAPGAPPLSAYNIICHNDAFSAACRNGHLAVAEFLADRFALTVHDIWSPAAGDCAALRYALGGAHTAVAKWIVARFALTEEDAAACDAFNRGSDNDHVRAEVLPWLRQWKAEERSPTGDPDDATLRPARLEATAPQ